MTNRDAQLPVRFTAREIAFENLRAAREIAWAERFNPNRDVRARANAALTAALEAALAILEAEEDGAHE